MLTFLLAASIGMGTPDAKLMAVVVAHVSEVRAGCALDHAREVYTPSSVRPLSESFGRAILPEVDLLPLYEDLPPYFRTRP
ncbi:MAG: hypothetical protein QF645_07825 [Planctomycetota bacterium]|nr:hypothetical protein [Planctomycetota bacterium]